MGRIVIAEDDPNILNLLKVYLEGMGHEIHSAEDGKKALQVVEKVRPDVLISDIMMPELNGYQLVHILTAERHDIPTPKIILLTSRTQTNDVGMGMSVGADMYVTKPFDITELGKSVEELLSGKGSPKEKD